MQRSFGRFGCAQAQFLYFLIHCIITNRAEAFKIFLNFDFESLFPFF